MKFQRSRLHSLKKKKKEEEEEEEEEIAMASQTALPTADYTHYIISIFMQVTKNNNNNNKKGGWGCEPLHYTRKFAS